VEVRNRIRQGDTLHILSPALDSRSFMVDWIEDTAGSRKNHANVPMERVRIPCEYRLVYGDILRKINAQ
ncbi:MAG TPA: U32 family peptidase C-terminal domain-containing protein, partial [Clostridia bacterium]|nr:U32 family peptidase C-terminal domain-containing protein [Clostridia bacterium]